jgi:hypothetical protein
MSWFKRKIESSQAELNKESKSSYLVSFGVRHYQVRLTSGIPDGEGFMTVNKFGECTLKSPVLKMDNVKMFGWYLKEKSNGENALDIQIAGQIFSVLPAGIEKAKAFFLENLIDFKDRKYPDE